VAVVDDTRKEAPNLNESHLSRPAKEKSTDASVFALSETAADLSLEIAKTAIAIDRQRERYFSGTSAGRRRFVVGGQSESQYSKKRANEFGQDSGRFLGGGLEGAAGRGRDR
jgi:hypothetical protein